GASDQGGNGGRVRTHQQRGRQQADRGDDPAKNHARQSFSGNGSVDVIDQRHSEQERKTDDADTQFHQRVYPQGVKFSRNEPGEQQASQTHSTHERSNKYAQGNGRNTNDELQ